MEDIAGEKDMTMLIKYPKQTKERNKVFFEKKDQELTSLDWSGQGGWFDTDGTLTYNYDKVLQPWKKRADLKLKDRQPVELFSKTFETSLTNYLNKTTTPNGNKYAITMHQAILRGEKADWFTKHVYPYLIKEEKKNYAAKILGYRPESKNFSDWTIDEVIHYLASALEGDGDFTLNNGKKTISIRAKLNSNDVQYLSDIKYLIEKKLGITSTLAEGDDYKTQKGIKTHYTLSIFGSSQKPNNIGFFQSLVKDGVMTLDRKKQRVQKFVNYKRFG